MKISNLWYQEIVVIIATIPTDSAIVQNAKEKFYDFDYLHDDDDENNKSGPDDEGFDEIIDIITPLDL